MKFLTLLISVLVSSPLSATATNSSNKALALFPQTIEEIELFTTQALETFQNDQSVFIERSKNSLTYEGVVSSLDRMLQRFCWKRTTLMFLHLTTSDQKTLDKAAQELKRFDAALNVFENNLILSNICLSFANQVLLNPLPPSQNYLLVKLLESLPPNKLPEKLYQTLSKRPMQRWTYLEGNSSLLRGRPNDLKKSISVLSWNVCFFPEGLSMIFGGALPWEDRCSRICDLLKEHNSDIICLQEVFSPESAEKLYLHLKDTYAHFYITIGPIQYGFSPKSYGLPSGLFVASKLPLDSVAFTPYNASESPASRYYGFFSMTIQNGFPIRLITTHLQPGSSSEDRTYRANQIKAITTEIDATPFLTFVCGDLNIERGSGEYKTIIEPYFLNFYESPQWTCLELRDYWWKAQQNAHTFYSNYLSPEWIDYFLQSRKSPSTRLKQVKSFPILVNDPHDPAAALSDHQAIMTLIVF